MEEYDKKNNKPSQYLVGFNTGYTVAREHPAIAEKIKTFTSDTEYIKGIREGHRQFVLDKTKTRYPSWLKDDPSEQKEQGADKQPSRDIPKSPKFIRYFERE
jgi:hypothetical protein